MAEGGGGRGEMARHPGPQGGVRASRRAVHVLERPPLGVADLDAVHDRVAEHLGQEPRRAFVGRRDVGRFDPHATRPPARPCPSAALTVRISRPSTRPTARPCVTWPPTAASVTSQRSSASVSAYDRYWPVAHTVGRPEAASSATRAAPRPQPPKRKLPGVVSWGVTRMRQCRSSPSGSMPRKVVRPRGRTLMAPDDMLTNGHPRWAPALPTIALPGETAPNVCRSPSFPPGV